jgi:hypothetical protein
MTLALRLILCALLLAPVTVWGAVANDRSDESHTGTTGSASEASFSWTHASAVSPRGILVFTCGLSSATNDVTSVTYGGVSMTAVTGGAATDTITEPGNMKAWFLGASVPTGNQTVIVNRNNNANILYAVSISVTASSDTATHDAGIVLQNESGVLAEQSVTDGSPGTDSMRVAGAFMGHDTVGAIANGASTTGLRDIDVGSVGCKVVRETTLGQGARSLGWSEGASDDRAAVYLAIKETGAASGPPVGSLNLLGVGR